jgi:dTMP kinase
VIRVAMHGIRRGVFISFEGVEGSGKTTQARSLVSWLDEQDIPNVFVREPGSTEIGESIRTILLNPEYKKMHPKCEVMLFLAARSQLVYEKIIPALSAKKVVVSDRFSDSTMAYQTYARDMPERLLSIFLRFATAAVKPDLTLLFDIDVSEGRTRGVFDDRMETEDVAYHERVRDGYMRLARRAKKRIKVLDGSQPIESLHHEVFTYVTDLLTRKGYRL